MIADAPNLAKLFARHQKAVFAFSGGKDSLVCLDLCGEFRDQLDVCWVNTGAAFPQMAEFVRRATEGFNAENPVFGGQPSRADLNLMHCFNVLPNARRIRLKPPINQVRIVKKSQIIDFKFNFFAHCWEILRKDLAPTPDFRAAGNCASLGRVT